MRSPNEFWLSLHNLAEAYDAEGLTADERTANILEELRKMPPMARRQVLLDMQRITTHLDDLFTAASAIAREDIQPPPTRTGVRGRAG
jgi:hypothetical protein